MTSRSSCSRWVSLTCVALLYTLGYSQSWDYSYKEFVMEEIPIHKMIKETEDSGYYDFGNGMYIKALVFELGGCSRGHPCAVYTGASHLPPDGCPIESSCSARWIGDPWRSYDSLCFEDVRMDNLAAQEFFYRNATLLVTEWFDYNSLDCQLRRNANGTWTHEEEGVAVVIRAQGFTFPSQTVIVSDVDTVPEYESSVFPHIMQEASINFAMLGGSIVKPTNSYASDFFSAAELYDAPDILDPISVILSQDYLNALDLGLTQTTVDASIAGLTWDKIFNFPEFWYHDWQSYTAGGVVWADFASEFDTMVHSFALGNKRETDADQVLNLYPLKVRRRCQCSKTSTERRVVRPTGTEFVCTEHLVTGDTYTCDGAGPYYCNRVRRTVWDGRFENGDGTVRCSPRNATATVLEVAVGDVPGPSFSWPASPPAAVPLPSSTPNASASPSSSASASASATPL